MSLGACGTMDQASRSRIFQTQLPVDYIDTTLTINVWGTADANLSNGAPAKLWYIEVEQTNNGATVETIELEITINGTAYTWTLTGIASGAIQYCGFDANLTAGDFTTVSQATNPRQAYAQDDDQSMPFTAATVGLIRARQTTAVDVTSAQIEVNIIWDRLVTV